jgi:hypothetical protein
MKVDWTTNYSAVEQQDYTTKSFMRKYFVSCLFIATFCFNAAVSLKESWTLIQALRIFVRGTKAARSTQSSFQYLYQSGSSPNCLPSVTFFNFLPKLTYVQLYLVLYCQF